MLLLTVVDFLQTNGIDTLYSRGRPSCSVPIRFEHNKKLFDNPNKTTLPYRVWRCVPSDVLKKEGCEFARSRGGGVPIQTTGQKLWYSIECPFTFLPDRTSLYIQHVYHTWQDIQIHKSAFIKRVDFQRKEGDDKWEARSCLMLFAWGLGCEEVGPNLRPGQYITPPFPLSMD